MRHAFALVLLLACTAVQAQVVRGIVFSGNRVTEDRVMLREMSLRVGDVATDTAIEDSRQAILDLGLFRSVAIDPVPVDGGVRLDVRVREKRYLLPIPRIDASSDEDLTYGLQLRWSNVFGHNHRLNAFYEEGDYPNERLREREETARFTYDAPYVFDSDYDLRLSAERLTRGRPERPGVIGEYDETIDSAEVLVARDFTRGRPRTGWTVGGGLLWQRQTTAGEHAPPPDGRALAAVGVASYDAMRFHVYSETGRHIGVRMETAADGLGSDYGYTELTARWFESRAFGTREHETLHVIGEIGAIADGADSRNEFSLGGSGSLRGYDADFVEGNRYYYGAVEWLRPVRWNWLRLMVLAEAGGADDDIYGASDGSPYASIGVGARIRLTWFVDVELELGVAYPLRGGDGPQFFAGGN